jgi:hypothetical protein
MMTTYDPSTPSTKSTAPAHADRGSRGVSSRGMEEAIAHRSTASGRAPCLPRREETVMLRPIHRARPICCHCRRRPALTRIRGSWRVVKDHDLCRQCWRSLVDSKRAWERAG